MWFDQGKLSAFAAPATSAGQALLDLTAQPPFIVDLTQRRHCPRCTGSTSRLLVLRQMRKVVGIFMSSSCRA
jgi:hypothetical protein